MNARRRWWLWMLLWPLTLGGCRQCPESFVSLGELVDEFNANAGRVHQLWARARIQASFRGAGGVRLTLGSTSPLAPSNGYVMLRKRSPSPDAQHSQNGAVNFVLIGKEIVPLFHVGLDADHGLYYLWYNVGGKSQAWFGRRQLAGAPGVQHMPIDPTQLAEILGVTELPQLGAGQKPTVVMTLQNDPCAYVVQYLKAQPVTGHLKVWRRVYFRWSDKEPRRPYQVELFDADGLCRVVAEVGSYAPIAWDGPADQAPVMPTDIRLNWPAIRNVQPASSLRLRLSEMSATREFGSKVFDFWWWLPEGVTDPIQVDAAYGPIQRERPGR